MNHSKRSLSQQVIEPRQKCFNKPRIMDVLAAEGLELKRQGRSYRALCPFHSERTPSFTVDPGKGLFYCFGCGVGGDVISLARRLHDLSFSEALTYLGVDGDSVYRPDSESQRKRKQRKRVEEWCRRRITQLSTLLKRLDALKQKVRTESELAQLADLYHQESHWICELEILEHGTEQQRFSLHCESQEKRR